MACQVTRSFANRACLDALGRQLQPFRDTGELTAQMQRLWQDLPQGVISDLIESMPRRISACIAARVAAVAEWYRYRTVACLVIHSSPVPLKIPLAGQRCTLNLSRAETSSRWCSVLVRRGGASSGVVRVT
ncbi:uncharacterized protein TNCV_519271 [Trichonephila clavipes]|nr:uncharacterized protein TNCV_519271 [Trichonephila clavipes]